MALLVKELSKTTQFLVVSHNDTVLSMADAAIGVTKSPEGHSVVVGVQLEKRDGNGSLEQTIVASA
ncbi:Chromosome partition protein Smc [Candidatus Gugararchaeum adminiculabundum]|nr:Chromosome partition protein Smc [Candidatus Gugararchaeum adminiculabundum]